MSYLESLKQAKTKPDLANLLGIKPSSFTFLLYKKGLDTQYSQFKIPKRSGGFRVITSPAEPLKFIQSSLSQLLLNCADEIRENDFPAAGWGKLNTSSVIADKLKIKVPSAQNRQSSLSHGFERNRSIITNAMMHLNQRHVFNIDLKDFFGSFNFGRVRGFFIKNKNFELDEEIATVIAKIACYDNKLPQGSPCSPVIANLITHSLDIKLSKLASGNSCIYTRYADDLTFSTRERELPESIARLSDGEYFVAKKLRSEIKRSGFDVNSNKTRNQIKDSRQDVTGLIVNKKPNTKFEYRHLVRAQCHKLFHTGEFTDIKDGEVCQGDINVLEGRLNFIDQVDHYNRYRQKPALNKAYQLKNELQSTGKARRYLHTGREALLSKFLFYKLFYASDKATILTEGKTDIIYLKSALKSLVNNYPALVKINNKSSRFEFDLRFIKNSKRTKFLLELSGGTDYLTDFLRNYKDFYDFYKAPKPKHPVIIFVDNDKGLKGGKNFLSAAVKQTNKFHSSQITASNIKVSSFVHVVYNLYIVLTPLGLSGEDTDIEYFFTNTDRLKTHNGKSFNTVSARDERKDLSKDAFSVNIVGAQWRNIDFSGFPPLLDRIQQVIDHYKKL